MQKGFYDLTSGMLTQNRILNNISDNLTNVSTPGYKRDELMTTTFDERMQVRTGNIDKSGTTDLASASMLRTVDEVYTVFEQGAFQDTGRTLDFAMDGDAFFEITTDDGSKLYTRNGSFTLDEEGRLQLQNVGLVDGTDGQPITLNTDKIYCAEDGTIYDADQTEELGKIRMVMFEDRDTLLKTDEGMFSGTGGTDAADGECKIKWKYLEDSNSDMMEMMTQMITAERAFQSAAQVLQMYDEVLQQTVTEIGEVNG